MRFTCVVGGQQADPDVCSERQRSDDRSPKNRSKAVFWHPKASFGSSLGTRGRPLGPFGRSIASLG